MALLVEACVTHNSSRRSEQNLHVEPWRPVLDVPVVPLDPIGDRRLPAQPVDLRPAGDTRLHAVPVLVAAEFLAIELNELGTLRSRANETHLASENVEELGQLIERRTTQECSEPRSAIVTFNAAGRASEVLHRVVVDRWRLHPAHAAELQDLERRSVTPNADLAEEDRPS